ncbi:MAG: hypothetical protein EXX96DRAFT_286684 [Benjaminiella poitrasii]|nr:MAG: hypothetical protein EXX96DRAFT_286684 [Benjaminiella poitrasii]
MASNKEEPNASFLFGDSTGDDPFSQLQQQNAISEKPINQVNEEKNPTVNKQPKTLTGDTSNLFGSNSESNADMFFSSGMAASRSSNPPLTSNASAASFFDQPQSSDSFFDNLNQNPTSSLTQSFDYAQSQQQTPNPAVSLIQAYDPNPYTSNYNQQEQVQAEQQQQQQQQQQQHQYDQSQWIQFDPNVHYYYDEQGQVHYYDPNTNQEYDMSQYGYDEQGQNYEYQYDPQYADYYNQQGYDPNTYAATNDNTSVYNNQQQQTYTPSQDNYDSNAYAPAAITQQSVPATAVSSQSYYDPNQYTSTTYGSSEQVQQQAYNPQAYASVSSAIAEVPAQVQSEQTIDTQSYLPEQQEQFGIQNYASAEFSNQQVQQTQEYSYQAYNSSNISHSNDLQQDKNEQDQYVPVDYTSTDANQTYSQIQTDFEEEDLQQKSHDTTSFEPAPKNPILSSPKSAPSSQDIQNPHSSAEVLVPSTYSSQRGSFDGRSEQQQGEESSKQAENLDDLDDLVLGGSSGQQKPLDNSDSLMAAADYDRHVEETSSYTQLNSFEEGQSEKESLGNKQTEDESVSQHNNQNMPQLHLQTEPIIFSSEVPSEISSDIADEPKQRQTEAIEIQQPEDLASIEPENKFEKISSEPQSDESEKKDEQIVNDTYNDESAATKGGDTRLVGTNEPVQDDAQQFQQTAANEPEQSVTFDSSNFALQFDQFASVESYQPVQYESEQGTTENKTMLNSEPQSGMVDHESQPAAVNYESQTNTTYEPYVPNYYEHAQTTNYEPEQTISYEPEQITSYEPEQTTSYEPQQNISYEPQQNISYQQPNNYQPQQAVYPPPTSVSRSGMSDYSQTAEQLQRVTSPPHSGSIKSMTPPPLMHNIQSLPYQPLSSQQRSNSITETDRRRHSGSPFSGYNNNQFTIERSATVPPPITDRVVSPRPQLIPCPDPNCEGENKPKAKFCCECGQPLTSLSRSTTPSINMSINQFGVESFNPISSSLGAVTEQVQRSALDDKKDAMVQKFKEFIDVSVVVNNERDVEEKRKHALEYISGCIDKFEDESKALLWRLVKLMLEHHEHTLGDG